MRLSLSIKPPIRDAIWIAFLLATWVAIQALVLSPGLPLAFACVLAGVALAVTEECRA